MRKIGAFVAHSFDERDRPKIDPILQFLSSFTPLGFVIETAERAEADFVSVQVCNKMDKNDVFVGILTKKYPIYDLQPRNIKLALNVYRGRLVT